MKQEEIKEKKRSKRKRQGEAQRVKPANICTSITERESRLEIHSLGRGGGSGERERWRNTHARTHIQIHTQKHK